MIVTSEREHGVAIDLRERERRCGPFDDPVEQDETRPYASGWITGASYVAIQGML
jgi:hypothetical protein